MRKIIIVGGGTAGWLTAGILASRFQSLNSNSSTASKDQPAHNLHSTGLSVTLIESPDVATIGVGEGTWPSMRSTLKDMGISETEFIRECDVSLKQGTRFNGWVNDSSPHYHHPFTLPAGFGEINLAEHWLAFRDQVRFGDAVSSQGVVSDKGLSAKHITTPEYAFSLNYGYHLDAGKFASFLKKHCVQKLDVEHISDHVTSVVDNKVGEIDHLVTEQQGELHGDLFIDCTGFNALLIGKHFEVPLNSLSHVLFNDRALAVQVPYQEHQPANSCTWSSAQSTGWVWDISLSSRRGVGYVYSSQHANEGHLLDELKSYLRPTVDNAVIEQLEPRTLSFEPGYRLECWHKNCIAIGLSGGFVEPLEASALVLVETAAKTVANNISVAFNAMPLAAKQFNQKLNYHWKQIVDFLKLHYVLNQRHEHAYWRDHLDDQSIPDSLKESLEVWQFRAPWQQDAPRSDELFSSASFQYVLYGMGFKTDEALFSGRKNQNLAAKAEHYFVENQKQTANLLNSLPTNKDLQEKIKHYGFQRV